MSRLDLVNASVITGDGKKHYEKASIVIEKGFISQVTPMQYIPYNTDSSRVIDVDGALIIPGLINIHFHGGSLGPLFPNGWKGLTYDRMISNLDRHLLQGTTSVVNCDGFALPSEVEMGNKSHPINIKPATIHMPKNISAGEISGGDGLEPRHKNYTIEQAVREGAVAIGEVGSPSTTAGTAEKNKRLGRVISVQDAAAINKAIESGIESQILATLKAIGLTSLSVAQARKLYDETMVVPVEAMREAILETPAYSKKYSIPVLAHHTKETKDAVLAASKELGPKLVALHANHTFTTAEAVDLARQLKKFGSYVEVISADAQGAKQLHSSPEVEYELFRQGLVDEISTDWSGGYHDPLLLTIKKAVEENVITLPRGIQMVTSSPAMIVPGVAPNRGEINSGRVADLCIVDRDDITRVKYVIIGGRIVVEEGKKVTQESFNWMY